MRYPRISMVAAAFWCAFASAEGQQSERCAELNHFRLSGIEITKAELIAVGKIISPPYPSALSIGPLPHTAVWTPGSLAVDLPQIDLHDIGRPWRIVNDFRVQ